MGSKLIVKLFFLDIEIKGEEKKGLDIAKEIRKKDPNATIVFVTTHSEFMPVTFKYRVAALDFIDKALNDEFFYERVRLAIEYTMDKLGATIAQDSFTFETSMAHVQVPFNNILFFETSPTIHNIVKINKEEKMAMFDNNIGCPISRTKYRGLLEKVKSMKS